MKPMRLNISTMEYRVWVALRAFGIHGATGRQVAESLSHDIDSTTVTVYHLREKVRAASIGPSTWMWALTQQKTVERARFEGRDD